MWKSQFGSSSVVFTVKWTSCDLHFKFTSNGVHLLILVRIYTPINKRARNIIKMLASSNTSHSQMHVKKLYQRKAKQEKTLFSHKSKWGAGSQLPHTQWESEGRDGCPVPVMKYQHDGEGSVYYKHVVLNQSHVRNVASCWGLDLTADTLGSSLAI